MKTREEQIQEQAELCFGSNKEQAIVFAQGARWADHTPNTRKKIYIILGQVESNNEELQGLWLFVGGRYFDNKQDAEEYANTHNCVFRAGKYNIVELGNYDIFSGVPSKVSSRKLW